MARTSVKYSCCLPCLREVHQHMQIMHNCTAPQIKHILPDATVAGATALPAPHMCQGMFHGYALAQLRPPLRRALAFTQLLQQGFIGMNADAAAGGAGGTASPQRTAGTRGGWDFTTSPGVKDRISPPGHRSV
jgi:hypothetical protein